MQKFYKVFNKWDQRAQPFGKSLINFFMKIQLNECVGMITYRFCNLEVEKSILLSQKKLIKHYSRSTLVNTFSWFEEFHFTFSIFDL